jgi:hypothetical protein
MVFEAGPVPDVGPSSLQAARKRQRKARIGSEHRRRSVDVLMILPVETFF